MWCRVVLCQHVSLRRARIAIEEFVENSMKTLFASDDPPFEFDVDDVIEQPAAARAAFIQVLLSLLCLHLKLLSSWACPMGRGTRCQYQGGLGGVLWKMSLCIASCLHASVVPPSLCVWVAMHIHETTAWGACLLALCRAPCHPRGPPVLWVIRSYPSQCQLGSHACCNDDSKFISYFF